MKKIRDKTLFRWLVVQHFDDVNQLCKEARENGEIPELIKRLEKMFVSNSNKKIGKKSDDSKFNDLKLPSDFIYLVYKNIIIKANVEYAADDVGNSSNIKVECNFDFESFDNDLKGSIEREYSLLVKENNKDASFECTIADLRCMMITQFMKISWQIIDRYFSLTEFGFPTEELMIGIMNKVLNGKLNIAQAAPKVVGGSIFDLICIEKLKKENDILRKIINDNIKRVVAVDDNYERHQSTLDSIGNNLSLSEVANKMIEAIDEDINMRKFIEIMNKDPRYYIEVNSYVNAKGIKDTSDAMVNSIEKFRKEKYGSINKLSSNYETIKKYSILYASKRFNEYMTGWEIADALSTDIEKLGEKEPKNDYEIYLSKGDVALEGSNINRDIEKLCEQTGFSELNYDILKNNSKYKESKKFKL